MDAGRISRALADEIASREYDRFKEKQRLASETPPSVKILEEAIKNLK